MIRPELRALALADAAWLRIRAIRAGRQSAPTAGAGVQSAQIVQPLTIGEVAWPEFPSLAHSFWRAQELTLFRRHRHLISMPALDIGCGDGLFGVLAEWPADIVGADFDRESLGAREKLTGNRANVFADAGNLPFAPASFAVCVANSVFEHLPDLGACLREAFRVLQPGGRLIFTMTLGSFSSQLRELTGETDTRAWLNRFGHFQEPSEDELLGKVKAAGFSVEETISYQPKEFTARYRMLLSPVFQFIERRRPGRWVAQWRSRLATEVAASISTTPRGAGACAWIVARKEGG